MKKLLMAICLIIFMAGQIQAGTIPIDDPGKPTVNEMIMELSKYGYPWIYQTEYGWLVKVDIVSAYDMDLQIKSDYLKNPSDALSDVLRKTKNILKKITFKK